MSAHTRGRRAPLASNAGLRRWLIGLYPPRWRERYGDEFDMLLAQCLRSPLDVLDIVLGALDARLGIPSDNNWRSMNMVNKLRTSILMVFAAYIGFVIGGMSLYGLADDSPMAALMKQSHGPLFTAWVLVAAGSAVSLAAVVIGGTPLAAAVIRRALSPSHAGLGLLLVPVASFAALVLYAAFMAAIGLGLLHIAGIAPTVTPENFPVGNRLLIGGFMLVFILGAIASTVAVWKAVSGLDGDAAAVPLKQALRPYEFARIPAVVAALAMLLMLVGTAAWGWLSYRAMPQVFASNQGLLQSNTASSFAVTLLIMLASTAVAAVALHRMSSTD